MKKFLLLVMAVAIAGIAFAETDPVFSGTFKAWYGYSISGQTVSSQSTSDTFSSTTSAPIDVDDSISLNLNATIDEWNTVSVSFGVDSALFNSDDKLYTAVKSTTSVTSIADGTTEIGNFETTNKIDSRDDYLRMSGYTLTSDILGALGVTGPVGLKVKFGKFGFSPAQVVALAPLSTKTANGTGGTSSNVGMQLDFSFVDMVTLSVGVYPQQLFEKKPEMGINLKAVGIADMIDFAAYFIISSYDLTLIQNDGDKDDENGDSVGASVAVSIGEMLKIGVGMEYNLEKYNKDKAAGATSDYEIAANEIKDALKLELDTALTLGNFGLGVSLGIAGLDTNFANNLKLKASATYKISDKFSIFGGIGLEDFRGDIENNSLTSRFLYDVGFSASLGNLGIQVAGSRKMDFKSPKDKFDNVIYVMFSSKF